MFLFTPKHLDQARIYLREAAKLVAYRKDVVSETVLAEVHAEMQALEAAIKTREKGPVETHMQRLDEACRKLQPPLRDGGWRENVEVFVVAISIALGVRTYFVQPFTIPTGSMQPTLNGIISKASETPSPNLAIQALDWIVRGRSYFDVTAERSETIRTIEEKHRFGISLGPFTYTVIETDAGSYSVSVPEAAVRADKRCSPGRKVNPGEIIARGYTDSGDHVLVDKFTYHFLRPTQGNVFVFNTAGIPTRENVYRPGAPSQFYIKRLAASALDQLRIDPPTLFRNGHPAPEPPFQRVMAGTAKEPSNGYCGYSNGPEHGSFPILGNPKATFDVPPHCFFALGDNSYHSSDSRDWGPVPESNVVGRGLMVYWPFSKHWGAVR
jgi:signal peptidase I